MVVPESTWNTFRRPRCRTETSGWSGVILLLLAVLVPSAEVAAAGSEPTSADEAAREIQEARDRANEVADAYFEAESVLAGLQDDLVRIENETTELRESVDELELQVGAAAAQRFVQAGSTGIPLLTDIHEPSDHAQAEVFVGLATNNGLDVLDRYEQLGNDLEASEDELADQREAVEDQQEELEDLQTDAEAEVERLREMERERLTDEAVQRSLEAQLAEERAQVEERARLDAEAAARTAPNPGLSDSATAPTTTLPASPDTNQGDPSAENAAGVAPAETAPPTTATQSNDGPSGGTSGGRTGGGGAGNRPAGFDSADGYVDMISCPITGSAFGNTWGAARSGGRSHQGVDMIAPAGVPIYAVTAGYVTFKQNRLGGNAASLMGDNGNRYYFAHFSRYEGNSRRVAAGDIIGYNGKTGNTDTNHLHFELRPGAGRNVNPYPSVKYAGC